MIDPLILLTIVHAAVARSLPPGAQMMARLG